MEKALMLHHQGYNCAQAVCAVFADKVNLDEDTLFRLSEGFGAGTGNLQGACGVEKTVKYVQKVRHID